jgi:hypothetical protein
MTSAEESIRGVQRYFADFFRPDKDGRLSRRDTFFFTPLV